MFISDLKMAYFSHFGHKNFFTKTINIIFMYFLAPFIVPKLKKTLWADPEFWGSATFSPKMVYLFQFFIFFQKPIIKPCSFNWCLSTFKKSNSDVDLLIEYLLFKETTLPRRFLQWEPDFFQAYSFHIRSRSTSTLHHFQTNLMTWPTWKKNYI